MRVKGKFEAFYYHSIQELISARFRLNGNAFRLKTIAGGSNDNVCLSQTRYSQ
jgi:hypothetical protein